MSSDTVFTYESWVHVQSTGVHLNYREYPLCTVYTCMAMAMAMAMAMGTGVSKLPIRRWLDMYLNFHKVWLDQSILMYWYSVWVMKVIHLHLRTYIYVRMLRKIRRPSAQMANSNDDVHVD